MNVFVIRSLVMLSFFSLIGPNSQYCIPGAMILVTILDNQTCKSLCSETGYEF